MKIKKYEARTEQEAIEKVKDELGLDALVLNIKKTQPKGVFSIFRKPFVEVTAAYGEKSAKQGFTEPTLQYNQPQNQDSKEDDSFLKSEQGVAFMESIVKDKKLFEQQETIRSLENKLSNAEDLLEKVVSQISVEHMSFNGGMRRFENSTLQLFYESLVEQGVTLEIAEKLLEDLNYIEDSENIDINLIVKIVYNTIISVLSEPCIPITENIDPNKAKVITFMGPTGVGKTTTIAKLSSIFILQHNLKVGLITADTYRIAAVEQLKTYAEILDIDVGIVYNKDDLEMNINKMSYDNNIILLDTAGRSHKNPENFNELKELLSVVPDCEKFLVLSVTTKYEDLINIVNTFSDISDFKLIFTKLDETTCLGSILNICYLTGHKVYYVTNGQNVPDDIDVMHPEKIAMALLGLGG